MSRSHFASLGVALACVLAASVAQATVTNIPVPNGDFSLPDTDTYRYVVPTSWSATNLDNVGVSVFGSIGGGNDQFLYHDLFASGQAWLYQTDIGTNFVQGDTYKLEFDYANGNAGLYTMKVNLCYNNGNTALATQVFSPTANQTWTHGSVSGIATSESTGAISLVFEFDTPSDTSVNYQAFLDNVTLTRTSSVPEPSSCVAFAMGLFGMLAYAWRKRR